MTDIEIVAQRRIEIVDAKYTETGVRRYKGNPFIEALPRIEKKDRENTVRHSLALPVPTRWESQAE